MTQYGKPNSPLSVSGLLIRFTQSHSSRDCALSQGRPSAPGSAQHDSTALFTAKGLIQHHPAHLGSLLHHRDCKRNRLTDTSPNKGGNSDTIIDVIGIHEHRNRPAQATLQ